MRLGEHGPCEASCTAVPPEICDRHPVLRTVLCTKSIFNFTPKYRLDPSSYNIRATARTTARRYVAHLFSGAHCPLPDNQGSIGKFVPSIVERVLRTAQSKESAGSEPTTVLDLRLSASFLFVLLCCYSTPYRHAGLYLIRLVLDPSSRNRCVCFCWPVSAVPRLHNF